MDRDAAAKAIDDFLRALGHEPTGDLAQTGELVAEAWCEDLLSGYAIEPTSLLREGSIDHDGGAKQLVAVRRIAVATMCPHHLLPAHGHADIVYLPGQRIAGFGTIMKAVNAHARRLALQEQLTARIAAMIVDALGASGALCRLQLTHTCMLVRGSRQTGARVETIAFAGTLDSDDALRAAALTTLAAEVR